VGYIGHNVILLQEPIKKHKSTLANLITGAIDQIPLISEVTQSLISQTEVVESKIVETFDDLVRIMNERKDALLRIQTLYSI
jgi:hypothetical protein